MDYTFTNFAVGSSNQFAHAAALAVAQTPTASYNPLLLYGGPGVGKTHLLHAIAQYIMQHHTTWRVVYLEAEHFMRDLLQALQHARMPAFQQHYRQADVLLVDDVHCMAGRPQTQEAFLHVFDALYAAKKQIVLASAHAPRELAPLATRLRSRLVAGLSAPLEPPELDTRLAILAQKAAAYGILLPPEVARVIAQHVHQHGHALEQCFSRIVTYASLSGQPFDSTLAAQVFDQMAAEQAHAITVSRIQQAVATYFDVTTSALRSKRRQQALVFPRQIAMFLCRELTEASLGDIGKQFGGRKYTTVLHAANTIVRTEETDDRVARVLREVRQRLKA